MITPVFKQAGTETAIVNLCEYLKKNNMNVIVFSSGGEREKEITSLGIRHVIVKYLAQKRIFSFIKAIFLIKDLIKEEKISLIHATSVYTTVIAKIATLISWTRRPRVIMTLHGGPTRDIERKSAKILNFFADKVIALSQSSKRKLIENGLNDSKIEVINNGIKPLIKTEKANKNKIIVGSCGRLSKEKGHKYIIEAAKINSLINIEFWIIGDGLLKSEYEKKISEYGITEKVKLLGLRKDINNLLNNIDIFIQPSLWEQFGISIIEAMSLAKPIIASHVGGIPEVLGDCGILINPQNPYEIAEAIKKLVADESLRKELGLKAQKRFYENFTQEIMGEKTLDVYNRLYKNSGMKV